MKHYFNSIKAQQTRTLIFSWGILVYSILLYYHIFHYKELILAADGGDTIIKIFDKKNFYIFGNRWGIFAYQIPAIITSYICDNIQKTAFVLSISIYIFKLFTFLFLLFYHRNTKIAFLASILSIAFLGEFFLQNQWTLLLGLNYAMILLHYVDTKEKTNNKITNIIIFIWLSLTLIFTQLCYVIVFISILVFNYTSDEYSKNKLKTITLVLTFFTIIKFSFFNTVYDNNSLLNILGGIIDLPNSFHIIHSLILNKFNLLIYTPILLISIINLYQLTSFKLRLYTYLLTNIILILIIFGFLFSIKYTESINYYYQGYFVCLCIYNLYVFLEKTSYLKNIFLSIVTLMNIYAINYYIIEEKKLNDFFFDLHLNNTKEDIILINYNYLKHNSLINRNVFYLGLKCKYNALSRFIGKNKSIFVTDNTNPYFDDNKKLYYKSNYKFGEIESSEIQNNGFFNFRLYPELEKQFLNLENDEVKIIE